MFGNPILYGAMRVSDLVLSFILGSKGLEILKRDTNLNTLCLFQFHFQSLFKNISQYQMPVSCVLHESKYTWHFICPAHIIWDCGKEFKTGREASAKAPNAWSLWLLLHASKALLLSLFFQTSELYVKYPPNWGYMAQVSAKLETKWEVRMKTVDRKKRGDQISFLT